MVEITKDILWTGHPLHQRSKEKWQAWVYLNGMHPKHEFMLNHVLVKKEEKKNSALSPDLERHLEESFKHNDSVLKRLAQM